MLRLDDLVNRYVANYAASINRYNKANIPGDERNQEEFLKQTQVGHRHIMLSWSI